MRWEILFAGGKSSRALIKEAGAVLVSRQGITRLTQGVCLVNPGVTRGTGASAGCVRSGSFSEPQHLYTNRVDSQCSFRKVQQGWAPSTAAIPSLARGLGGKT